MGNNTFRSMRPFVFPFSSICQHKFRNVYYVPVGQRRFQDIRIEVLHIPFEDSTTPTNVMLHFRKNYKW